jgi:hypothetical protein
MNHLPTKYFRHLTCVAALVVAACSTTSQQISPQATGGLTDVRAQAVQLKQQLSRTADSARNVSKSSASDLKTSVEVLSSSVKNLNSTLASGSYSVAVAQEQVRKYFDQWAQETNTMPTDLQKTSQERQAEAAASFKSLRSSIDNVRTNTWPFINDMNAVADYLRTDQTQAGVDAVSPRISKTLDAEPVIQRDLDQVIAQIDAIQNTNKK